MKRLLFKIISRWFKEEILTIKVKHLYNTIDADDILKEKGGKWYYKGRELSDAQKSLLIAEANQFLSTTLWKILQTDVKYQANRAMYLLSKSNDDIVAGKLWTETLNCFKTRLESMIKGSALFNKK